MKEPSANSQRPSGPYWLAMPPTITTTSMYAAG